MEGFTRSTRTEFTGVSVVVVGKKGLLVIFRYGFGK